MCQQRAIIGISYGAWYISSTEYYQDPAQVVGYSYSAISDNPANGRKSYTTGTARTIRVF